MLGGPARRGLRAIVQVRARRALLRQVLQRLVHERAELLLAHRLPQPVLHLVRVRVGLGLGLGLRIGLGYC